MLFHSLRQQKPLSLSRVFKYLQRLIGLGIFWRKDEICKCYSFPYAMTGKNKENNQGMLFAFKSSRF
jgi:hypothetical protein